MRTSPHHCHALGGERLPNGGWGQMGGGNFCIFLVIKTDLDDIVLTLSKNDSKLCQDADSVPCVGFSWPSTWCICSQVRRGIEYLEPETYANASYYEKSFGWLEKGTFVKFRAPSHTSRTSSAFLRLRYKNLFKFFQLVLIPSNQFDSTFSWFPGGLLPLALLSWSASCWATRNWWPSSAKRTRRTLSSRRGCSVEEMVGAYQTNREYLWHFCILPKNKHRSTMKGLEWSLEVSQEWN